MTCIRLVIIAKLTRGEKSIDYREMGGARERGGVYMNQREEELGGKRFTYTGACRASEGCMWI